MTDSIVATATTNPINGSVVRVLLENIICSISIEKNIFSDDLPIIPMNSRVHEGKILYRLKLRAQLHQHSDGRAMGSHSLNIKSRRGNDKITSASKTNDKGELSLIFETRDQGAVEIDVITTGVTSSTFKINLKEAWYESPFLITGYHVCDENDFDGPLVKGKGLDGTNKEDFLFGARGVPMQGTGKATDGRYVALVGIGGGWHRNSRGAPDHVVSQSGTSFKHVNSVEGKYGPVIENNSIGVDPTVIPPHAKVEIDGVGKRSADDKGSAIREYHIDNFLGAGDAVVKAWMHGNINGKKCRVKYLGDGS